MTNLLLALPAVVSSSIVCVALAGAVAASQPPSGAARHFQDVPATAVEARHISTQEETANALVAGSTSAPPGTNNPGGVTKRDAWLWCFGWLSGVLGLLFWRWATRKVQEAMDDVLD